MSPTVPAYISSFLPTWTQPSGRTSISPNVTAEGETQQPPPPQAPALGWDRGRGEALPVTSTKPVASGAQSSAGAGDASRASHRVTKKSASPLGLLLTHHVEDALVVGHNDGGALHLKVLQSFHLKPQAEEIFEGLDHGFDDPTEEEKSGQTAAGQGCSGGKETRTAL